MSTSTLKKFFTISQLMSTFNPGRTRLTVKSLLPVGTIICGITAMAGRRSLCLVNRELHAEIEILGAAKDIGHPTYRLFFVEKILSNSKFEPVGKHSDATQGLRVRV